MTSTKNTKRLFVASVVVLLTLAVTNPPPASAKEPTPVQTKAQKPAPTKTFQVKAKFLEFSLGDASHFSFTTDKGKYMDFGGCEAKNFKFSRLLPKAEMNTDNQGWGSNKELQGKWFLLTYKIVEREMYIDGPIGKVKVITKAALVKK